MKIGVLLSGCGVYDGSEIHEAVSTLIALDQLGAEAVCMAPDVDQHHVVNHLTGEETGETRNVLVEAARIARGAVRPLGEVTAADLDGLVLPGGFGAAKNLSTWAFDGPAAKVEPETARLLAEMVRAGKPVAALCVSPVVLAKVLEGSGVKAKLTVGTTEAPSPYDVGAFNEGLAGVGADPAPCALGDIVVDEVNRIVTSPCYMLEATVGQVYEGIRTACEKLLELARTGG